LGDFSAGIPDVGPLCVNSAVPGCLPSSRPPISSYGVASFRTFFQNTVPKNYTAAPPVPLTKLPGPYFYSNFSVGLMGLLLATPSGPLAANAVDLWFQQVSKKILQPLGMTETYLAVPKTIPETQIAQGYSLATAKATITNGAISQIAVGVPGGGYDVEPIVRIVGGSGHGATARATIANGQLLGIAVKTAGSHYIARAQLVFKSGGAGTTAKAEAVISGGHIMAVRVNSGGAGYVHAPTVTITGGGGTGATATAHIANGRVTAVIVANGGTGYVSPLSVVVAPGTRERNIVPVWAAAGAIKSTIADMTNFTAAAVGLSTVGTNTVPAALTDGFAVAQAAYACEAQNPRLVDCPAGNNRAGLAWAILPADTANGMARIVTKNGGLAGFSSQVVVIPGSKIGVVVLANSDNDAPAQNLAFQIAYNIYYGVATHSSAPAD
jgi:CubicO group peptidase (beta-lactamase class C family)